MLARKIVPIVLILVVACLCLIVGSRTQAMASEDATVAGNVWGITPSDLDASKQPNYKAGEIIVKFKKPVADAVEQQLAGKTLSKKLKLTKSLDNLNGKHKVKSIEPMFKDFKANQEQMKNILKKNPKMLGSKEKGISKRMQRAPKGAKVPELGRIYKVKLEDGQSAAEAVKQYNADPDVEYAELNYVVSAFVTEPNDSNYSPEQWALNNTGQLHPIPSGKISSGKPDADIDAPEAWDITTGSSDVIVAVLDTGVDYSHRDLKNNIWADTNGSHGYDFVNDDNDPNDDNGHGTHCAGIIAADGNNEFDVVGVCWTAKIMAVKFLDSNGRGSTDGAVSGIYYATNNGADIISNSWGGGPYSQTLKEAFDYAFSQGVFLVAAAGNDNDFWPAYPAYFDNVMAVAATDHNDAKAYFSNYGNWIDVAAPGESILSLRGANCLYGKIAGYKSLFYPNNDSNAKMAILSGTSMACPHVAGVAALCLSEEPNLSAADLWRLIINGADDLGDTGWDPYFGAGRVNAYNTLNNIVSGIPAPQKATSPYPADSGTNISVNAHLSWQADKWVSVHLVYFGTDYNNVNNADTSSTEFKGEVWVSEFDPNVLSANTTYYWRIDEKNPTTTIKGDIWSITTGPAGIIYVDANASGSNNGSSWANAFTDLHNATEKAFNGDEIWVAEGTYKPTSTSDRSISFALREGVSLRGGFEGTETDASQRDPNLGANITTLSGDIGTIDDNNDNSYHVIRAIGKHAGPVVIDRFTIVNGNASLTTDFEAYGGGVFILSSSSVTIKDSTFTNNRAIGIGGGIWICDSNFILNNCAFNGNMAYYGGAIGVRSSLSSLTECSFQDNVNENDGYFGGAIYFAYCDPVVLTDCIFTNNATVIYCGGCGTVAANGCEFTNSTKVRYMPGSGAIYSEYNTSVTATKCMFKGNNTTTLWFFATNDYLISDCTFANNNGNGLWAVNSPGKIENSIFADNNNCGAKLFSFGSATPETSISNCLFYGNSNSSSSKYEAGGGICNYACSLDISNCTFAYNNGIYGGGLYNYSYMAQIPALPKITNCVFWGNTASVAGNQIYNFVEMSGRVEPNISYSDIEGSGGSNNWDPNLGNDLGGNIDSDPCFVDADNNDFHIKADSPCVNAGDPNGSYDDQNDIDGESRVIGRNVDIGADEVNFNAPEPNGHWWKLDETSGVTAYDSVDTNNGTFNGDDPCWVTGHIGGAVDLNGVSDYFSVSSLDTYYSASNAFSVAGWFNTSKTTGMQTIVGQWNQCKLNPYVTQYFGWQVLVENKKVVARLGYGNTSPSDITGTRDVNGGWHHFVFVYPTYNSNAVLYVDGQSEGTPVMRTIAINNTKFRIGDGSYVSSGSSVTLKGGPFCGMIDDVMIYKRALTATEVNALYNAGR
jgi:subtilisin family serine protease